MTVNKSCQACFYGRITQSLIGLMERNKMRVEHLNSRYCIKGSNFVNTYHYCQEFKQKTNE